MAETKNYDNIRIYGDLESEVLLAPLGTELPVDLTDLDPAFLAMGWLSEDGVALTVSANVEKFRGWQGGGVLRTKVTSTDKSFTVQALEESPVVTELFFDHAPATVTGTGATAVAKLDLPEGIGTVARAAVVKFKDGDVDKWLVCTKIEVGDRGDVPHTSSGMTIYEMGMEIIGAAYILTNNPAYLPANP